jgi:pimeloyl-ACP methyl ester carboxylesterase
MTEKRRTIRYAREASKSCNRVYYIGISALSERADIAMKKAYEYPHDGHQLHLVCVGGLGHSSSVWSPLQHLLHQTGVSVEVVTFPGAGSESNGEVRDISKCSSELASLCRRKLESGDNQDLFLAGHSFGATIVLGAAQKLDTRCSGLLLLNASLVSVESIVNSRWESFRNLGLAARFTAFLTAMSFPGSDIVVRSARSAGVLFPILRLGGIAGRASKLDRNDLDIIASIPGDPSAGVLVRRSRGYDIKSAARAISCNVALLDGMDDALIPSGDHRLLAEQFRHLRLERELSGVGHLIPLEAADAVVEGLFSLVDDTA